jgi:hypothetical protein
MDHAAYQKKVKAMTLAELHYIIRDAHEAERAMPDGPKAGHYLDEINYCANELARRKQADRACMNA